MPLSMTVDPSRKSTQLEIVCELKNSTPANKLRNNGNSCQLETEIKVSKKNTDEKAEQDRNQLKNEKFQYSTQNDLKIQDVEIKNIQIKHKKEEPEVKKQEAKKLELKDPEVKEQEAKKPQLKDPEVQESKIKKPEINQSAVSKVNSSECKMIPIRSKTAAQTPSNVAVPRKCPPLSTPLLTERPIVLATHLVPSLPISLFEILVEIIEVATEKPVVLLCEPRSCRPVAMEIVDIAILPASEEWDDGELLPVSFCFEHHLNKDNLPCVYADVIVAIDHAPHVETITDLRGYRCSLPDRKKKVGAASLLFSYLYSRGESPAFFGNTLDADTQLATLQMVAGKQAEIGVLESPVIKCHKDTLPGIEALYTLSSLGPLPPYRIMVKKSFSDVLAKEITAYLLNVHQNKEWMDKFAPYGVTSFVKNSAKYYDLSDIKSVVTSVPYY